METTTPLPTTYPKDIREFLQSIGEKAGHYLKHDPIFRKNLIAAALQDERAKSMILEAIMEEFTE